MKRKIIACLLSITMLCSLLPMFALATSAEEDPTGTLSVTCPVCQTENCTEHTPCATCGEYNCTTDHSVMPTDDGDGDGDGAVPPGGDEEGDPDPEVSFYETLIKAESFEVLCGLMTDEANSADLSALSYDQLKVVDAKIDPLYVLLAKKDADTEYQRKLLHGQIDTLIAQNDGAFAALIDSCKCSANKSRLVVHATDCSAYIAPPEADVTEIGTSVTGGYEFTSKVEPFTMDLTYAMQFATQASYTDLQKAYYGTWVGDFVITTNKQITGADAYLAGQFDMFNEFFNDTDKRWVKISMPNDKALEADQPLQLIPVVTGQTFPFLGVVQYIPTFNCGIWVSDTYLQENPDFAVSVELRLYPSTNGEDYDPDVYVTLSEINYQTQSATINYVAGNNGTVSEDEETVGTLVHPSGSTPTAAEGYHFAGWYYDAEYKIEVPSGWVGEGNKLIPGTNSSGTYDSATYYAKFDPNEIDVTVNVSGNTSGGSTGATIGETYLFVLSGTTFDGKEVELQFIAKAGEPLKIAGLPDGNYTVTPVSGWNWRENVGSGTANGTGNVDISATNNGKNQWFSGYAYDKKTIG